jgi:hypothetical protein
MFQTNIIQRETISSMVDAYHLGCSEIDQAYILLQSGTSHIQSVFGDQFHDFSCYPAREERNAGEIKLRIRKNAWRVIINRLEIHKFMSIADLDKLQNSFDSKEVPEIELGTVMDIVSGMVENAPEYAKKLVLEVYEILMPGTRHTDYKTNIKNARRALGKKVILSYKVEMGYGNTFRVNYNYDKELVAIDKVFFALDGKGIPPGYRSPLVDAISSTPIKKGYGETDYFRFRCCQNRNLHLEFKRLDLVSKLNQIVGLGGNRIAD